MQPRIKTPIDPVRQARLVVVAFLFTAYCGSFALPVKTIFQTQSGMQVVVEIIKFMFKDGYFGQCFMMLLPNALFCIGIACLWRGSFLGGFAFLAGLFATVIAGGWMMHFGMIPMRVPPRDLAIWLHDYLGAYVWLACMWNLAISGFAFSCINEPLHPLTSQPTEAKYGRRQRAISRYSS